MPQEPVLLSKGLMYRNHVGLLTVGTILLSLAQAMCCRCLVYEKTLKSKFMEFLPDR